MLKLTTIVHEEAKATKKLLDDISLKQASSEHYDRLLKFLNSLCDEVIELTNAIGLYLSSTNDPQQKEVLQTWLIFGSYVIRQINDYCSSFEHAEILSVPTAIRLLLNKLLTAVTNRKAFIIRGDTEFNYTYQPIGARLNELALQLSRSITPLEESFAVLIFPIAYSKNVMADCNLVHEMGHLIVDGEKLTVKLESSLPPELKKTVADTIERHARNGKQLNFYFVQRKDKMNQILNHWIHETLADFVAILLIGPCSLFSFMKLIEPLGAHDRDDDEHPCTSIRIKMMLAILQKLKWDDVINKECPHVWKRAIEIASRGRHSDPEYNAAAECLPLIEDYIYNVALALCNRYVYAPNKFIAVKEDIYALLERGIPPAEKCASSSTLGAVDIIDPESIINGGWIFYENDFPKWNDFYGKLDHTEKTDFLNRLIGKAIEVSFVEEARNKDGSTCSKSDTQ